MAETCAKPKKLLVFDVGLIGCRAKLAEGIADGSKDSDKDEADGGGHRENYTDESKHEEHR